MLLNMRNLVGILTLALLVSLGFQNSSFAQEATICLDADGDGWGWNGTDSCRIQPLVCVDSDGDGWGWDGSDSCRTSEVPTPQPTISTQFCIDNDGDGWGWNGTGTCVITLITDNTCIDTDNDGWGWNGTTSCLIDTQSGCIDSNGDGWGWNGYQSCLVSDPTKNCVINGVEVITAIDQPQCDALLDIYNSTGGDNWINNDQWMTATDPCTWYGVYCEANKVYVWNLLTTA